MVAWGALGGCMPNPAWDGCVGGDPCGSGTYCDPDSRECVSTPGLPPELDDLPLLEWMPVSRNVVAAASPCPADDCVYSGPNGQAAVVDGWNGGVYADAHGPFGGLMLWGAGSSNYNGNEVYFFDLATLLWSTLSQPTDGRVPGDASTFEPDPQTCAWWDGAPIPLETLGAAAYVGSIDAFVLPSALSSSRGDPRPEGGCSSGRGFSFSLDDATWSLLGDTLPDWEVDSPSAYDPSRDVLWTWVGSGQFAGYSIAEGTWTVHYDTGTRGSEAVAAIVPHLDLFVVADFEGGGGVRAMQLDNPFSPSTGIATVGDTEIEQTFDPGFSWSESLGAIVTWSSGAPLYLLHPPETDWATEPWRWERLEVAGDPPPAPARGPYGRFQVIDKLGIAVVTTRVNEPVFAVRFQ